MTLGLGRDGAGPDPDQRPVRAATSTRSRRRSPRTARAGRRPIAIVATVGTTSSTSVDPVAAIADIAEREGLWLHVDAAYAGVVALLPERRGAVRGLGARRLDRRQPAQVAVHAARRVAAADAPDGRAARRRSASCPSTCARSTGRRRSTTTTSTRRSSAAASGRSSCGCSCAGSGSRGCGGGSRAHLEHGRRRSPAWVDADPDWERLAPVPFSTVCFRWRPARLAAGDRRRRLDDAQRRDHGRRQPDRRGLPVAHPAGRPVHDPGRRSATCGPRRATSSGPGTLLREAAAVAVRRRDADAARRPVLRDARRSCATGSTRTTRPPTSCGSATTARRRDAPSVDWSARGRRGAVRRLDRRRPLRPRRRRRYAQRFTPRRKGSTWSAVNVAKVEAADRRGPDASGRAGGVRGADRRRGRRSTRTSARSATFTEAEIAALPGRRGGVGGLGARPPSYRQGRHALGDERQAAGDARAAAGDAHRGLGGRAAGQADARAGGTS